MKLITHSFLVNWWSLLQTHRIVSLVTDFGHKVGFQEQRLREGYSLWPINLNSCETNSLIRL